MPKLPGILGNGRKRKRKPRKLKLKTRAHQMLWQWLQQPGNSQSGLARELTIVAHRERIIPRDQKGIDQGNVGKWLGGMTPRAPVFRAIQEVTGIPVSAWGELVDDEGPRRHAAA